MHSCKSRATPLKKKIKFTKPVKRTLYTQSIRFECDSIIVRQYPTAKFMAILLLLLLKRFLTAAEQLVSYDSALLYWFPLSETNSIPFFRHDSVLHTHHCHSKQKFVIAIHCISFKNLENLMEKLI